MSGCSKGLGGSGAWSLGPQEEALLSGRLDSEGRGQEVAEPGGVTLGRAGEPGRLAGQLEVPGGTPCPPLFLVARAPASWGLYRLRIQLWGSGLGRELGRETQPEACCRGEGCPLASLTHGGQGLTGSWCGDRLSALPATDAGGSQAHRLLPGLPTWSPICRYPTALGQDRVCLVLPGTLVPGSELAVASAC